MDQKLLRVVVVDDDFMIAKVHAKYIESQQDYQVVGIAFNYEQALLKVMEFIPDLLILDVFMPDRSGLELLRTIRIQRIPCDVILITAARELDVVEEGFRLGIFDYLIKPFDLDHLKDSLIKYKQFKTRLLNSSDLNQAMVDDLKKIRSTGLSKQLQTGIDFRTLEHVKHCLIQSGEFQSAEKIAKTAEISRSTARMYLAYLVEEKIAEQQLLYGTVGRPRNFYRIKY